MSKWNEILIDYVDENGVRYLDGYLTDDPDEGGHTIGWVLPNGAVLWQVPDYQFDELAKEALAEARELQKADLEIPLSQKFYDLDKRGVSVFTKYSEATGKFGIECYRKKTAQESQGENDCRMVREGYINAFDDRSTAESKAIEFGEQIAKAYNY